MYMVQAPDDCNFVGYGHDVSPALDANGNVSVNVKLTSRKGTNYVSMDAFGSISDKIESIETVATGKPSFMTGSISNGGVLTGKWCRQIHHQLFPVRCLWKPGTKPIHMGQY